MKEVTREEFVSIMESRINLGRCKICGHPGGDIIISSRFYGKEGVIIKCRECNYQTGLYNAHTMISHGKTLGTPIIEESLINAIISAVIEWNNGRRYIY